MNPENGPETIPHWPPLFRPAAFEKRGLIIAVEGLDGSGKTTVMERVQRDLAGSGREVVLSNWNDAAYVYNLSQQLTLDGAIEPSMRLVLAAAELAARLHYEILPALERGAVVILNKYLVAAMAHSRVRGHSEEFVRTVYRFAPAPDLLLYFDVDPAVALARKGTWTVPGFWESGLDLATGEPVQEVMRRYAAGDLDPDWVRDQFFLFQSRLRALQLNEVRNCVDTVVVDANKSKESVEKAITSAVLSMLVDDKEEHHARTS